jgi:hypothetical protein
LIGQIFTRKTLKLVFSFSQKMVQGSIKKTATSALVAKHQQKKSGGVKKTTLSSGKRILPKQSILIQQKAITKVSRFDSNAETESSKHHSAGICHVS